MLGEDPSRAGARLQSLLGVQLQLSALPGPMTPAEAMRVFARYHRMQPRMDLLARFGIEASAAVAYRDLSVGQQRRLNLALAIAHRPKLVLLDEPTAGLDVASRAELHDVMRELRSEGVALALATHDMAEAESLADRVAIILRGKVATTGTPREITAAGPALTRVSISTSLGTVRAAQARVLPGWCVLLSQAIFLPSMMLGGLMIPSAALPASVRPVAGLLPTTYAMRALEGSGAAGALATLVVGACWRSRCRCGSSRGMRGAESGARPSRSPPRRLPRTRWPGFLALA